MMLLVQHCFVCSRKDERVIENANIRGVVAIIENLEFTNKKRDRDIDR
jgi:hypothetical protein